MYSHTEYYAASWCFMVHWFPPILAAFLEFFLVLVYTQGFFVVWLCCCQISQTRFWRYYPCKWRDIPGILCSTTKLTECRFSMLILILDLPSKENFIDIVGLIFVVFNYDSCIFHSILRAWISSLIMQLLDPL